MHFLDFIYLREYLKTNLNVEIVENARNMYSTTVTLLIKYRGKVIGMHPLFHPLYIDFCTYFNGNQDYFECHEVLEEYWKEIAPGEKKHPLVGYIQIATGLYHWRRGNYVGAKKILSKGLLIFDNEHADNAFFEKIDFNQFVADVRTTIKRVEEGLEFQPFKLNIIDEKLKTLVNKAIKTLSEQNIEYLLNKHALRNRTDIIEERLNNLRQRGRS